MNDQGNLPFAESGTNIPTGYLHWFKPIVR